MQLHEPETLQSVENEPTNIDPVKGSAEETLTNEEPLVSKTENESVEALSTLPVTHGNDAMEMESSAVQTNAKVFPHEIGDCESGDVVSSIVQSEQSEGNEYLEISQLHAENVCDDQQPYAKDIPTVKMESQSIKDELLERPTEDTFVENPQTRNLFETVGLVLKTNSQTRSYSEEAAPGGGGGPGGGGPGGDGLNNEISNNYSIPTVPGSGDFPSDAGTTDGKPSYCHFCGFPAPSPEIYQKHMKLHDRSNSKYSCFLCNYRILHKEREFGINHYANVHGIEEKGLFKCGNCLFVSSDKKTFEDHVRLHFLIKPHSCSICYMTFVSYKSLITHHSSKHRLNPDTSTSSQIIITKKRRGRPAVSSETPGKPVKSQKKSKTAVSDDSEAVVKKGNSNSSEVEPSSHSQYVLPVKELVLQCSFCGNLLKDKKCLAEHLLSSHREEFITLKPLSLNNTSECSISVSES